MLFTRELGVPEQEEPMIGNQSLIHHFKNTFFLTIYSFGRKSPGRFAQTL
jgi:hypothetical protein